MTRLALALLLAACSSTPAPPGDIAGQGSRSGSAETDGPVSGRTPPRVSSADSGAAPDAGVLADARLDSATLDIRSVEVARVNPAWGCGRTTSLGVAEPNYVPCCPEGVDCQKEIGPGAYCDCARDNAQANPTARYCQRVSSKSATPTICTSSCSKTYGGDLWCPALACPGSPGC